MNWNFNVGNYYSISAVKWQSVVSTIGEYMLEYMYSLCGIQRNTFEPVAIGKSVCACNSIECIPRVSYDL